MRLRNVTGAKEEVIESKYVIREPETKKGDWQSCFTKNQPIHIEIGMGKGQFITELALRNPDINYIGIEKYASVLVRALKKRENQDIPNLFYLCVDAKNLCEYFAEGEVDRIYLNFSDPWPKDRHSKRRLTAKEYFERYSKVISKTGIVAMKTDNEALFDFSLQQVAEAGWKLQKVTRNLHQSEFADGNIMTEYEEKFSSMGNPIYRLEAYR